MIRFSARAHTESRKLLDALERAERAGLSRAGSALRKTAMRSIRTAPGASSPGAAPHTRRGLLRRSILDALVEEAGRQSEVVGPSRDIIGLAGKAHEFGGKFRSETFDERAFMRPAMSLVANQLPAFFAGTVKKIN